MKKLFKVLGILVLVLIVLVAGGVGYLKIGKPDVGAAPQLKVVASPEQIEHGKYLANHVMLCIDCHSTRDWTRFSAPIVPGTFGKGGEFFSHEFGFPGDFYSKNITPYNLKTWTDGEIYRCITTGVTRDNEPLFPIMPYKYYGLADEADIRDVVAYIRSLQPIESNPPASKPDFPFSLIERTIPTPANPHKRPDPSDSLAYGGYMVNLCACKECHTKVDDKAQLIAGTEYGGGREFDLPGNIVRSANITPDPETGIGAWTREQFIQRFQFYTHPENVAVVGKGDMNTIMPWTMYGGMTESDLSSIFLFLKSLKPIKNQVAHFSPPATAMK
ncbi:MAG: cytochrome C [Bacteroidetes bacterium]|nr:cytochrome C [Bacteroidota bacterium]MBS1628513.1 cytochrome C [Bacteroidota bacterium]